MLLPVFVLLRRADLVEVIGAALSAKAAGAGARTLQALVAAFAASKNLVDEAAARAAVSEVVD